MKTFRFASAALLAAMLTTAACSKHDDAGNATATDNVASDLGATNDETLSNGDLETGNVADTGNRL